MNFEANETWLILLALLWGSTFLFVNWMKYRQSKLVLITALGMHILLNTAFLTLNYVDFNRAGWVSIDGAFAVISSGLGWSLIACGFTAVACQAWTYLPLRWQTSRFVTLPYTIDAMLPRHSVLAQILFVSHTTVIGCIWLAIEFLGSDSSSGTTLLWITAFLEWSLLLMNLMYWTITDETQMVLLTMLPALIFGTMVYTGLGWLVDLMQNRSDAEPSNLLAPQKWK